MKNWSDIGEETSLDRIVMIARDLNTSKKQWHFHILAPSCKLNTSNTFVLILENTVDNKSYYVFCPTKPSDTGKELIKLLHGEDVMDEKPTEEYKPTEAVKRIIDRATFLNEQGKPWHHHMFFPNCAFNSTGLWEIVLEDPENPEDISSTSAIEPKNDLKQIETLFYKGTS